MFHFIPWLLCLIPVVPVKGEGFNLKISAFPDS